MLEPRLPTAAGRAGSAAVGWGRTGACRSKESTRLLLAPLGFYTTSHVHLYRLVPNLLSYMQLTCKLVLDVPGCTCVEQA